MALNPSALHPPRKQRGGASSTRSRHRLAPPPDVNNRKRRSSSQTDCNRSSKRRRVQVYKGMLDMPAEVVLMISAHLDDHNLRALALASQSFCRLLLPEYLRRRGLVVKDAASDGGSTVEVRDPSGYASLGLLSLLHGFQPPQHMSCLIPCATLEARSAFECLTRFLLDPSNTRNLRVFRLSLQGSNSAQLVSEFIKIRQLIFTLPLTHLYLSGFGSKDYFPPDGALRRGVSGGSHTLTAFHIWSDYAFAPGMAQTTMRILNHSPIKDLSISMVSLKARHWSILLRELNMAFLEDIDLEGDIPQPPLIQFLARHKGLRYIRIVCDVPSMQPRPTQTRYLPFLPKLLSLRAPLAICCDIAERNGDSSNLYGLQVGMSRFDPHDPAFRRLLEILAIGDFQKLGCLGLRLGSSSPSTTSQASLDEHGWYGYPARDLKQIRTLRFSQSRGELSEDIDTMCAYVRSFPMVEDVYVTDVGDEFGIQFFDSLCTAMPTLHKVAVYLGSGRLLEWTGNAVRAVDD